MREFHKAFTVSFLMVCAHVMHPDCASANVASYDVECAAALLAEATDEMTAGEIRGRCTLEASGTESLEEEQPQEDALTQRLEDDSLLIAEEFNLLAHRPNYLLPVAYNFNGWNVSTLQVDGTDPNHQNQDLEVQFQVSVKVPLAIGLFGGRADFYAAYTNQSFWQAYDKGGSQSFRETSHEPEAWLQFTNDWQVAGFTNSVNAFGYLHQSNGQSGTLSRGWDRLFANFVFNRDNFVVSVKPWIWLNSGDEDGDNPDIDRYMGHGELALAYAHKGNVYTAMVRNQLESGFERGALQLSWSFPIFDYPYLKGYIHYFYGYGESLIDYNQKVNSIGLGISITDWLK